MSRLLLILLLLLPLAAQSQIYRTTDEQGNVIFTDRPPAEGTTSEKVELGTLNTAPPPPVVERPAPRTEKKEEAAGYGVSIVSPENETSLPMGPGNFSVNANVTPSLGENDYVQLFLDGAASGEPQRNTSWNLTNVSHGPHELRVTVVDDGGEELATSEPVRVIVNRTYVSPVNRPRPTPR